MALDDYYPAWLGNDLLWDDFPWEQGWRTTMAGFLADYTLHDSGWISFVADPAHDGSGIAVIRWDTFWTDGRVPFPGSAVAEWPILLIRFEHLQALSFRNLGADIGGISRTISGAESETLPDGEVHRTGVTDVYDGRLTIDHAPEVTCLCLDRERNVVPIPIRREA